MSKQLGLGVKSARTAIRKKLDPVKSMNKWGEEIERLIKSTSVEKQADELRKLLKDFSHVVGLFSDGNFESVDEELLGFYKQNLSDAFDIYEGSVVPYINEPKLIEAELKLRAFSAEWPKKMQETALTRIGLQSKSLLNEFGRYTELFQRTGQLTVEEQNTKTTTKKATNKKVAETVEA